MHNIIIIAITFLGVFSLFILTKRPKKIHDYTLIILNIICAGLLHTTIALEDELTTLSFYLHNTLPFWLFGLFMLYAVQLITQKAWQNFYWLFFILAIPMTFFVTYDVYFAHQDFTKLLENRFLDPPLIYHFFYKGSMIYAIVLCWSLLRYLQKYTKAIQNNFSYIEKIRLRWLSHYAIALIIIYSFSLVAFLFYNFGWIKDIENIYVGLNILSMIAFFYLSFNGMRHYSLENIPIGDSTNLLEINKESEIKEPSVTTNKLDEKSLEIYQKLIDLFETSKLYTQPQLKLSDVASKLNVPPHQLSTIINAQYGKPFYDFVATYRVNLLKDRLVQQENKQYTILSLGLDCGFNSKASLNRVFKEHTGLTPSRYQKSHFPK